MCGISGILNINDTLSMSDLVRFNTIIKHRGPDDEGYWIKRTSGQNLHCFGKETNDATRSSTHLYSPRVDITALDNDHDFSIAFGHRRLAIVDLSSGGHQPMCSADGTITMTYNGEIYNHQELKKELETLGHVFQTKSDTEVIIHAYQQWGIQCLDKFNGMFAFLLHDDNTKQLFAVRDRFGVKPLYYHHVPGRFMAFASEIKQFTTLPNWKAILNPETAHIFIMMGIGDYSHKTMFEGVFQLRGGTYLKLDVQDPFNSMTIHTWYTLQDGNHHLAYDQSVDRFKTLFQDSVSKRLRSDVRMGTGLSGGLDSSSIVCMSHMINPEGGSHDTFSARSDDPALDEGNYIDEVLKATGLNNFAIWPQFQDLNERISHIIWHHDEPFSSTSVFAEWKIYELVQSKSVKVTLEGHGADELLLGYHYNFLSYQVNLIKKWKLWTFLQSILSFKKHYGTPYRSGLRAFVHACTSNSFMAKLKNYFLQSVSGDPAQYVIHTSQMRSDHPFLKTFFPTDLKASSFHQITDIRLPFQLHWADRDSMAHSVESRAPFLDYRLVEFAYNCPIDFKLDHHFTKKILRDAMNHILPESIRLRYSKIGFATPEEMWVRENRPFFEQSLEDVFIKHPHLIAPEIHQYLKKIIDGTLKYNTLLWRVLCFAKWVDVFQVNYKKQ